jgi:hypothetical protein
MTRFATPIILASLLAIGCNKYGDVWVMEPD